MVQLAFMMWTHLLRHSAAGASSRLCFVMRLLARSSSWSHPFAVAYARRHKVWPLTEVLTGRQGSCMAWWLDDGVRVNRQEGSHIQYQKFSSRSSSGQENHD